MSDPFAPFRRQLGESIRSEERVAWLGRGDTRPMGDCLPPGAWVLCHPRFPGQFRADNARHRTEFRRHGFTWTDAVAEELAAWRFGRLPGAECSNPELFMEGQRRLSESAARKEMADLDLNLKGVRGARFPWGGGECWLDGVALPYPKATQVERMADLSEAFAVAWEEGARDPGMAAWPGAFRAEFLKHNRILVYLLGSSRGSVIHVVVAYVSPLVLAYAPAGEVADRGDGLRVEWRPWDIGVGRIVREVFKRWKAERAPAADPFTYYSIGLDARHTSIPELLVPAADVEAWECLWVADGGDRLVSRMPPRAGFKRFRRDFTDRLVPETMEERLCRVRTTIDQYRKEFYRGSINIALLREATGYRRSVLRDLLLELEQRDGTGEKGYAVRLPKGKSKGDLDHIEVVPPASREGRAVLAKWYQPRWWIYWLWAGLPAVATAVVGTYATILTQGRVLSWWQTSLISFGSGVLLLSLRKFAEKRAKDSEDE
jgi:hypothetical protein